MSPAWQGFEDEIGAWRDAGRLVDFWWRDDDACRPDPALRRLIALSGAAQVPLALAAIPLGAQAEAFESAGAAVTVLQHGTDHHNRAAASEKKTEFPAREPVPEALARLAHGRALLERAAPGRTLPVLVPPWNRISATPLVASLAAAGYRGLSCYGPRPSPLAAAGLVMLNTHVDIIDWRGARGFVGEQVALAMATGHLRARRTGLADANEATGWLTHHAVHDQACWSFMELLFERTRALGAVRWRGAAELFVQAPR